jgi:2-amino-4-hydroxy-6-hydroxymethyldihydropteridine diphosphokinase
VKAVIGIGANLGDRHQNLRTAVKAIDAHPKIKVLAASRLFESEPIGGPAQGDYLNGVILIETDLPAPDLLKFLQEQEIEAGRVRNEHWGPRPLDLDIVDVAGLELADPDLTIPHPRVSEREFVLRPLADIDPNWMIHGIAASTRLAELEKETARPTVAVSISDVNWWK